jgi:hypothetical protein
MLIACSYCLLYSMLPVRLQSIVKGVYFQWEGKGAPCIMLSKYQPHKMDAQCSTFVVSSSNNHVIALQAKGQTVLRKTYMLSCLFLQHSLELELLQRVAQAQN